MPLAFARHRACDLDTDGVFAQTPTSSAMLAFLHYRTIRSLRDRLVSSTGRQPSPPMRRVHNKRLAGLEPRLPVQDPYVAGVLIALAQAQANASSTGPADAPTPSSTGSTFRVCAPARLAVPYTNFQDSPARRLYSRSHSLHS